MLYTHLCSALPPVRSRIFTCYCAAGFYVDATNPKYSKHYRMYSYVTKELPALIEANFPVAKGVRAITGVSFCTKHDFVKMRSSTQLDCSAVV